MSAVDSGSWALLLVGPIQGIIYNQIVIVQHAAELDPAAFALSD